MLNRRHFLVSTAAMAATMSPALAGLDPTDPDIKFGTTGSIFGAWSGPDGAMKMSVELLGQYEAQGELQMVVPAVALGGEATGKNVLLRIAIH